MSARAAPADPTPTDRSCRSPNGNELANELLEAALHYARVFEVRVLPLGGKQPVEFHSVRRATSREQAIRHWWGEKHCGANIGVIVGRGVFVLDVDGNEGKRSLRALEKKHGALPATVTCITPSGGLHFHFAHDPSIEIHSSVSRVAKKLDIVTGERRYIVVPPSVHPNGTRYRWKRGHAPGEIRIARTPKWLLKLILQVHHFDPVVPCCGRPTEQQSQKVKNGGDRSASGRDWYRALELLRQGASDDNIRAELRRTSKKFAARGESYLEFTVKRAREEHEKHAPVMRVTKATLHHLPPRFGRAERRHIELSLASTDGEIVEAKIIVPRDAAAPSAKIWGACFSDIEPAKLLAHWQDVTSFFRTLRFRDRRFEVAVRDGTVRWIKAVPRQDKT